MATYKIIRFYLRDDQRNCVIKRRLTLEQAQAHCANPETSSTTATSALAQRHTCRHGQWFDGYDSE